MNLTSESKFFLAIIVVTLVVVVAAIGFFSQPAKTLSTERLISQGTYTKGPATASARLVEFSDFQCPACKAYEPVVDELLKTNQDNIYFAYRHFPLPQHTFGEPAARAAEAAGKQGKFWEMYALLFARQDDFSDTIWATLAGELKLDLAQFQKDMASKDVTDKVNRDRADGVSLGINATPTFFLNGVKLAPMSLEEFKQKVYEKP